MAGWAEDTLKITGGGLAVVAVELLRRWKSRADRHAVEAQAQKDEDTGQAARLTAEGDRTDKVSLAYERMLSRLEGEMEALRRRVSDLEREMREVRKERDDAIAARAVAEQRAERIEAALLTEQQARATARSEVTRTLGRLEQVEGELRQAQQTISSMRKLIPNPP